MPEQRATMRRGSLDRVARYKEERRRQLAAQFGVHQEPVSSKTRSHDAASSSSEGPRPTRASKLRAAAALSQDNVSSQNQGSRSHATETEGFSTHFRIIYGNNLHCFRGEVQLSLLFLTPNNLKFSTEATFDDLATPDIR
ncbi:hypothetical protein NQ318_020621 [Aromia moschata]|uniref:Uncharacterized protein n=1 Tax=Aromia moschata TaxID=1265417 RepID=A0AAV8Z3B9_9CUCU|nr:hypothetical protein NQ318_020621 [Aromia moschata]